MLIFLNKINTKLNVQKQNLEKNKKLDSLEVYEDVDRLENELLELQSNLFALKQVSLDEKEIKTYQDKIISLQNEINKFDEKKEKEFLILVKSIANKQIDIEKINEKIAILKNIVIKMKRFDSVGDIFKMFVEVINILLLKYFLSIIIS